MPAYPGRGVIAKAKGKAKAEKSQLSNHFNKTYPANVLSACLSSASALKLKSYDHNLVDKSVEKIVKTVKVTGAVVNGPIPLPTGRKIFTRAAFRTSTKGGASSSNLLYTSACSTSTTRLPRPSTLMKLELPWERVEVDGSKHPNPIQQRLCLERAPNRWHNN